MRLDQRVHRRTLWQADAPRGVVDHGDRALHVVQVARLGQHQVRQPPAGARDERQHVVGEGGVIERVHTRADTAEVVLARQHQFGDPAHMRGLGAHGRAVLAVERDVEHRAQARLQRQALEHAVLGAAVVIADGNTRRKVAVFEEDLPRMHGSAAYSRCLTPSCSSSSSFSVRLMRSWLKASMARPSMILYSPSAVVTG